MNLPKVYTTAKVSPKGQINKEDLTRWFWGSVEYAKPFIATVGLIYLAPIVAALQVPGHVVTFNDFVPSEMVRGAVALYIVSQLYGLLRKFTDGKN